MIKDKGQEMFLDDDSDDSTPSLKIVMLGDSGVGKTSLTKRWSIGLFDPGQKPTIGTFSSLHRVKINKTNRLSRVNKSIFVKPRFNQTFEFKFSEKEEKHSKSSFFYSNTSNESADQDEQTDVDIFLWDTAGQEQYAPLSPLFLRQASSVILTVSCNDRDSLENAAKWINIVDQFSDGDPPIVLAVNKTDTIPSISSLVGSQNSEKIDDVLNRPMFTINEIVKKYPSKANDDSLNGYFAAIVPVSAKSGFNVKALFQIAAEEGYDYVMKNVERKTTNAGNARTQKVDLNSVNSQSSSCC